MDSEIVCPTSEAAEKKLAAPFVSIFRKVPILLFGMNVNHSNLFSELFDFFSGFL